LNPKPFCPEIKIELNTVKHINQKEIKRKEHAIKRSNISIIGYSIALQEQSQLCCPARNTYM
jgi:hypothetical protein